MATNYTYDTVTSNGIKLHFIKTSPKNVKPTFIGLKYIKDTSYYGVNGGYFNPGTEEILQIAVVNDVPVGGTAWEENVGWANNDRFCGTLVWDNAAGEYSIQVVKFADELKVTDRKDFWAQGGISMCLDKTEAEWDAQAKEEKMQGRTGSAMRTALVYNTGRNIWLVISDAACTAKAFRTAVKNGIGSGTLVDGIFLDGGASTAMRCAGCTNKNGSRPIPEMIALINKN